MSEKCARGHCGQKQLPMLRSGGGSGQVEKSGPNIAFSPVSIDGRHIGWFGLGPIAVGKDMQRRGIGKALIDAGLERTNAMGARGCVVLGAPAYYGRFGFESDASLRVPDVPIEYFQRLTFHGHSPKGVVEYQPTESCIGLRRG